MLEEFNEQLVEWGAIQSPLSGRELGQAIASDYLVQFVVAQMLLRKDSFCVHMICHAYTTVRVSVCADGE